MGRTFDATAGELAEKLYAALEAGDEADGDARGRQSASMLVVRKQGGRNTNNDRYIYINVDDNPRPFAELRRLLDLNLSYNYQDLSERLLDQGKHAEALVAGRTAACYAPGAADSHTSLGFLEYLNGNKDAARKEFQIAQKLDPDFKKQFDATIRWLPQVNPILDDHEFLAGLFPKK